MIDVYILYLLPALARVVLTGFEGVAWWKVVLSQTPLVIVLPSVFLPRLVRSETAEHVVRHATYAAGFTVAVFASLDVVYVIAEREVLLPLVTFALVGCATLWWFVLAHVLENVADPTLRTHQGDVTVLPLTLVAIATFVYDVPDAAFHFTRSTLFFVPVVVAWATLFFVAFQGFATQRTTTYAHTGFLYHASAALVVAAVHLVLIETRATAVTFQFFPPAAALFAQALAPHDARPKVRPYRHAGVLAAACVGFAVPTTRVGLLPFACALAALVVPRFAGRRWVLPGALLATVGSWTLYAYPAFTDALGLLAAHYLVLRVVDFLCPTVHAVAVPREAPRDDGVRPQERSRVLRALRALRLVPSDGVASTGDDVGALTRCYPAHPSCPRDLVGVWRMEGVGWAMRYATVQHAAWKDGRARVRGGVVYAASPAGWLARLLCALQETEVTVVDDRWIRTDTWHVPLFRFFHATFWVYRVSPTVLLRLGYDHRGVLVWKYRLVRIA